MFEPIWPKDRFSITDGEPKTYATVSAGSGKQVVVHFCGDCGTKLYLAFGRFPDVVGVYGGTLDRPAAVMAGVEHACLFVDEAIEGTVIPAGMKAWRQHRLTSDGAPIAATVLEAPLRI